MDKSFSNKKELRKDFLKRREALSEKEARERSVCVIQKLRSDLYFRKARTILIYVSKGKEISTHDLIKEASKEKIVLIPRLREKKLEAVRFTSFDDMANGDFGVLEPKSGEAFDINKIDLVVLPGLAFDKHGYRLGYGLGYFDQFLKAYQGRKIALAYDFPLTKTLPHDEWDVRVDEVISDTP